MIVKIGVKEVFDNKQRNEILQLGDNIYCYLNIDAKGVYIELTENLILYIEGILFYYIDNNDKSHIIRLNETDSIKQFFLSAGIDNFINKLEGRFAGVIIDSSKNEVIIFCDNLSRKTVLYSQLDNYCVISTAAESVLKELGRNQLKYDQASLCSLFSLGYTPGRHTIYENIKKLGAYQRIEIKNGKISIRSNFVPKNIEAFTNNEIDVYYELVKNSILSRSSNTENCITLTGGLDSCVLLNILLNEFDSTKVRPVITNVKLNDARYTLSHDVDRAKRIANHYGVKLEIVNVEISKQSAIDCFDFDSETLKLRSYFHPAQTIYFPLALYLKKTASENSMLISGEAADSLLNFGFTKASRYNLRIFNEFENKMKNTFFSPRFYEKAMNGKLQSDVLYRFSKWIIGADHFNNHVTDIFSDYFFSYVFSDSRIPYTNTQVLTNLCSEQGMSSFKMWIDKHYFTEMRKSIDTRSLYSWLIYIYLNFHLQGRNIKVVFDSMNKHNKESCIPYFDKQIVEFACKIPPHWGRMLTVKSTKYSSWKSAEKYLNIPFSIIKGIDYHSFSQAGYIFYDLVSNNDHIVERFRELLSSGSIDNELDEEYFNLGYINHTIQKYLADSSDIASENLRWIYGIACMRNKMSYQ